MKHLLLALTMLITQASNAAVLDDMKDTTPWQASASDQVRATLKADADGSLCLNYDFAGVSGYAVMRRALPIAWPAEFALDVRLKGRGAAGNDVQLKFVDASGDNVWWINRPALALPASPAELHFKRRHVDFAWGPSSDKRLSRTQFLELVVVAGQHGGGAGAVCLGGISLAEREPAPAQWPQPRVQQRGGEQLLDFQRPREFNGLWLSEAVDSIEASDDGRRWTLLARAPGRAVFTGEQEWRWLRLRHAPRRTPVLALRDATQWPDRNAMLAEWARALPRGEMPRAFVGEQNYWTVVGVDGGAEHSGLISEDGAIELTRGGPSVEPLVELPDGRRLSWADVRLTQQQVAHALPVVQWQHAEAGLRIEAGADGQPTAPRLLARYTLSNPTTRPQHYALLLLARPWQVNPPQQFLSTPGGISPLSSLAWREGALQLQTVQGGLTLRPTRAPQQITAAAWAAGPGLAVLQAAEPLQQLTDPDGLPSALLRFDVELAPGESRSLGWVAGQGVVDADALDARLAAAAANWRERLGAVTLELPPAAEPVVATLRAALAQILVSREGAALRPGTRSYARSWVRDGAMMVAGLLRLGEVRAAREFVDWFGPYIFESGKVPCCVDQRGADPVVENDSHGQYLYAVAEVWRHTQDRAWLQRQWPRVQRVTAWMEGLRQSERRAGADPRFFGLMPPSISHEGYSDKAAYSYWDDFWALRGYKDAVQIAQALGQAEAARRWAGWRDEFGADLAASVAATARHYGIDHIAGAADRGDFDATSTTMALNPAQAQDLLPRELLAGTFRRYAEEAIARAEGRKAWRDYTPYELRNISALVRLGDVATAHRLLAFFFADQRPAGWHQWAEVVLPDAREPRFLGDMPHAWVSSDYLRAALDLLAYEREPQGELVLGAGLLPAWREAGDIRIAGLSTAWGRLDYALQRRAGGWTLRVAHVPERLPGVLRLAWPGEAALPRARAGGRVLPWQGRELALPAGTTEVDLEVNP